MKALSVRQPWAGLIAARLKPIEIRTWSTSYRGPLLICASAYKFRPAPDDDLPPECSPRGVALAVVNLTDIRPLTPRDFEAACMPDDYQLGDRDLAWILDNPRPVEQVPVKGRLHLFDVPDDMVHYE